MVNFSMMTFLFFIVLPIGLCVLEIFLSRMDNKYIGLILPAITFIYSLIALLSFAIFDGATTGEIVVSMLTTFLGTNLPTLILLGIYFLCRENMRFRPGKRAGTDPLRRASGRQNPQSTKTSGFSSVLTHMSSEPDST